MKIKNIPGSDKYHSQRRILLLLLFFVAGVPFFLINEGSFVSMKIVVPLLGLLGGIVATSLVFYEAIATKRGIVSKICLYASGFILVYEFIILVKILVGYK
jgi:hypothetical protein